MKIADDNLSQFNIRTISGGWVVQSEDEGHDPEVTSVTNNPFPASRVNLVEFGTMVNKHLKSNAIALIKNNQLVGKGCGQTSRVDALRHAIEKAKQFKFDLKGASLASDAFFPFDDCVRIAHEEGIEAYIQPGGSVRDKDSVAYCQTNGLAMVMTEQRHFKH